MSRPLLTAGYLIQNEHISLDKVGLVANWKSYVEKKNKHGEKTLPVLNDHPDIKGITRSRYPYAFKVITVCGTHLELSDERTPLNDIRMEWNPNDPLMDTFARSILKHCKQARITRLDIALDYFDHDLSQYIMTTNYSMKTNAFYSATGKLETFYLGSKESATRYRIYDKAKERQQAREGGRTEATAPPRSPRQHWRIEVQRRFKPSESYRNFLYQAFADLTMVHPMGTIEGIDLIILEGLLRDYGRWGLLSTRKRKKYRDMLQDADLCTPLTPSPSDCYATKREAINDQLSDYLGE